MTLTNAYVIPGIHKNIFSMDRALQKGFQVTSQGDTLILKKNSTDIHFDKKMAKRSGKGFLPTTNFYKSANNAAIYPPNKKNLEGKASI